MVTDWLVKNELSLNVKKTKVMVIGTKGRVKNGAMHIKIDNDDTKKWRN